MEISELYNSILRDGEFKIKNKEEQIDYLIDSYKMGLILAIRPTEEVQENISKIQERIKSIEPNQYYYKKSEYHITLLDLIRARQDYVYTDDQIRIYDNIIKKSIIDTRPFKIRLKGLITSDGAIMVKGYYENEMNSIRENLREYIENNAIKNDEKYKTISSHITICRFKEKINNRSALLDFVKNYAEYDFGSFEVSIFELTYHNGYYSKKEVLKKYLICK